MHVLLIIIGLLLLVFGGGCTLIFVYSAISDFHAMMADVPLLLTLWVPLGLLPLVGGWLLFRLGVKIDRQKRNAKTEPEMKPDV